jgi:hypothetical protein
MGCVPSSRGRSGKSRRTGTTLSQLPESSNATELRRQRPRFHDTPVSGRQLDEISSTPDDPQSTITWSYAQLPAFSISRVTEDGEITQDGQMARVPLSGVGEPCVELEIVETDGHLMIRISPLRLDPSRQLIGGAVEIKLPFNAAFPNLYLRLVYQMIRSQRLKNSEELLSFLRRVTEGFTKNDGAQIDWAAIAEHFGRIELDIL